VSAVSGTGPGREQRRSKEGRIVKKILATAAAAVAAVPMMLSGTAHAASAPDVQFQKIQYNAPGDPDGAWNLNGEYFRLYNWGGTELNLQGWKVTDASGNTYTFPEKWLYPTQYVDVHTGIGTATYYDRYWGRTSHVWNNTGYETATLISKWGTIRDTCTYYGSSLDNGFKWC
jgi:hypothetical protein